MLLLLYRSLWNTAAFFSFRIRGEKVGLRASGFEAGPWTYVTDSINCSAVIRSEIGSSCSKTRKQKSLESFTVECRYTPNIISINRRIIFVVIARTNNSNYPRSTRRVIVEEETRQKHRQRSTNPGFCSSVPQADSHPTTGFRGSSKATRAAPGRECAGRNLRERWRANTREPNAHARRRRNHSRILKACTPWA